MLELYVEFECKVEMLEVGLCKVVEKYGILYYINCVGFMIGIFFIDEFVINYDVVKFLNLEFFVVYYCEMVE